MNEAAPSPALRVESLVKLYPADWRGRRARALDGVSFAVPRGTITALIGPNGSGKSTTLRVLAGLAEPTSGRCELLGGPVAAAIARGQVGYLPEETGFPGYLAAGDWLAQLDGLGVRPAGAAAISAVLALVGLAGAADRRIGTYSKGMRQRLGLAQALLGEPELLLLDEPATGLDPRAVEALAVILRTVKARGGTVLFTSHFLAQAEELADEVVLLDAGRVLLVAPQAAVRASGGLHRIYLEKTRP